MNHSELVAQIAQRAEITQAQASAAVSALADVVAETLGKGDKVAIAGLLTAEVGERAERQGRNPRTGETMTIAAGKTVKLKPAAALKRAV